MSISLVAGAIVALAVAAPQDVQEWIRLLVADDVDVRNRAGEALIQHWESDAVKKRVEEVEKGSGDAELKLRARTILGWMELRRRLGKPLVEAIGDVNRLFARDSDIASAYKGWIADPRKHGLEDPERLRAVTEAVVLRLTTVEGKSSVVVAVLNRIPHDASSVIWAAGVAPMLKDRSPSCRVDSMWILGQAGAKRFQGEITAMLADSELYVSSGTPQGEPVGAFAADVLATLGVREAAGKIGMLLQHVHPAARRHAALALAKLRATEFAEPIAVLLKDDDDENREAAAEALGRLGARAYSKAIGKLLQDKLGHVRSAAVGALAELGDQDHVEGIRALLRDEGANAALALAKLGRKDCVDQIAAVLADDDFVSINPNFDSVVALRLLDAKDRARVLKRAAVVKSARLGRKAIPLGEPYKAGELLTLAQLVDAVLADWGIDPGSLKD